MHRHIIVSRWTPAQTARIAGTGIDVFEVIKAFHEMDDNWDDLRQAFNWLSDEQLRAALEYYAEHKVALDERLESADHVEERVEELWRKYPHLRPAWR